MSSIRKNSPFSAQRRERETKNSALYINYEDYPQWASINNYLITGSRGTGKSSVLDSFDYTVRWFHRDVISYCEEYQFLKEEDIRNTDIIGLLFKADIVERNQWDLYHSMYENAASVMFSSYLSYYFASKALLGIKRIVETYFEECLEELSQTNLLNCLFKLVDPLWRARYSLLYDFSIDGLITYLEEQNSSIRQTVLFGREIDLKARKDWPSASSRFISNFCSTLCEGVSCLQGKKFFLMIDDVDRFPTWQIRCINSSLIVTQYPCSWKLSSSLPYQTMATEDDARISGTDLKISVLNDESLLGNNQNKDRIDELYEAIFRTRIKTSGVKDVEQWDLLTLFGKMDLEKSLKEVVSASLNPVLKADYEAFVATEDRYYTNYWLKEKGILTDSDSPKRFDKYRVNATFNIVRQNNLESSFLYSSYDIVRALCSGSPRHFLRICNAMWPDIYDLLVSESPRCRMINRHRQNVAIRMASNELLDAIDKDRINLRIDTSCRKICDRLGSLFILLTNDESSLKRSQECMSVRFNISDISNEETKHNLVFLIDKLAKSEVIKVRYDLAESNVYQIGLNPMLSPCFCISFRNPFMNSLSVDATLFYEFLIGSIDASVLAKSRISDYEPSLFDVLNNE